MPPQRNSGGKLLSDGFCVFTRIAGLAFHSDAWTLSSSFSKGRGSWFFGLWTFWIGFTLDTVRFFGLWTFWMLFHRVWIGFSGRWTGFSIGLWINL